MLPDVAFGGRTALVTGAASGIGRAVALAFAAAGAQVVVSDAVDAPDTMATLAAMGADADFVRCDVTRQGDVDALIARAVARYGRVDCACNNAGIEGVLRQTADYPDDVFERVIQVNLIGVWRCMRAEIRAMLAAETPGGAIVNIASIAGLIAASAFSAYVASKHGVVGLTRTAAVEYAKQNLRVNAVCPGVIDTPMLDRLAAEAPEVRTVLAASAPIGRLGTPEEVAAAVVWLCSDAASFVTGHALTVDGGYVAQ
jgi:NAD(P)-dependent dehydrogenase (short-subunit alcohol dehydrogenase family)